MTTKELEVLKIGIPKLKKLYENSAKKMSQNDILGFDLVFVYLDKTLQRLEAIDNANPNEALERVIEGAVYDHIYTKQDLEQDVNSIKQALLKAQEQEKMLSIIKEKNVDMYVLRVASSVEHYNNVQDLEKLTQEEFNLLKEKE